LNEKVFVRLLLDPFYDSAQKWSPAESYVSIAAGEYELHIACSWHYLFKSLRMEMWLEMIAIFTFSFSPSLQLSLKTRLAVTTVMQTANKRIPLPDR